MNKYVIYTSITGGYDRLKQLSCVSPEFDYICFTDSLLDGKNNGIWEMRPIPSVTDDKQRLSRYPKMHPHILLPEYEYSVYVDAKLDIINPQLYNIIKEKINRGVLLSGIRHEERVCVYDEFFAVFHLRKETDCGLLKKEYSYLKKNGMPSRLGLYDACLILRKHNNINIVAQNEMWWTLINVFSKRDQLSYTFSLWKNKIPFDYFDDVVMSENNDYCRIVSHTGFLQNMSYVNKIKRRLYKRFVFKYVPIIRPLFYFYLNH